MHCGADSLRQMEKEVQIDRDNLAGNTVYNDSLVAELGKAGSDFGGYKVRFSFVLHETGEPAKALTGTAVVSRQWQVRAVQNKTDTQQ